MDLSCLKNKKILVTGHTGFKGSWLVKMLLMAGAEVYGYSLTPPTEPNLFTRAGLDREMGDRSVIGDIRDYEKLKSVFDRVQPEFVIHLAAQPLVRYSYEAPALTYETNVMGTVNLLECVRHCPSVKSVLNVTTDKVYENRETGVPFTESDRLDGYDPYSNSKSCSELVTETYKRAYFDTKADTKSGADSDTKTGTKTGTSVAVSTARAGNVIGGGDYALDRLLPDCIRAAEKGETVVLRSPDAVRPFQHVLEPLSVYLTILLKQYEDPAYAGSYNIGPDRVDCLTVREMAELFCKAWGEGASYQAASAAGGPHEAGLLFLDNAKIRKTFDWHPVWNAEKAVKKTVEFAKAGNPAECMETQINAFFA